MNNVIFYNKELEERRERIMTLIERGDYGDSISHNAAKKLKEFLNSNSDCLALLVGISYNIDK